MKQRKKYTQKTTFKTQDQALDFATFKVKKQSKQKANITIN